MHRDLKPANIIINMNTFAVKICDFGLSKCSDIPPKLLSTIGFNLVGSIPYMDPDNMLRKKAATLMSDVWALGTILMEMYTEKYLWGDDYGVVYDKFREFEKGNARFGLHKCTVLLDILPSFLFSKRLLSNSKKLFESIRFCRW